MKKICKRLLLAVVAVTLLFTLNGCGEKKVKQYSVGLDVTQYISTVFKASMEEAVSKEGGQEAMVIANKMMAGTNNLTDLFYKEKGYNAYLYYNFNEEGKLSSLVYRLYINTNSVKTISKNLIDMMGSVSGSTPEEINGVKKEIDELDGKEILESSELDKDVAEGIKQGLEKELDADDSKNLKVKSDSKVLKSNKDVIEINCEVYGKKMGTILKGKNKKGKSDYEIVKEIVKENKKEYSQIKFSKAKTVYY